MMQLTQYIIDGCNSRSLDDFYDQVSDVLIPGVDWGHNLDAFNDILRGGFGTPDEGFALRWANSEIARANLGYAETVKRLEIRLDECHPDNIFAVAEDLENARKGVAPRYSTGWLR